MYQDLELMKLKTSLLSITILPSGRALALAKKWFPNRLKRCLGRETMQMRAKALERVFPHIPLGKRESKR